MLLFMLNTVIMSFSFHVPLSELFPCICSITHKKPFLLPSPLAIVIVVCFTWWPGGGGQAILFSRDSILLVSHSPGRSIFPSSKYPSSKRQYPSKLSPLNMKESSSRLFHTPSHPYASSTDNRNQQ
jgi:hypothetical protein